MACPVIESSHIIGKKWSIPIIEDIALGKFNGFNNFLSRLYVTPRILSMQLRELERSGIIKKRKYNDSSTHTTNYTLTEKGQELHNIINEIKRWNARWGAVPDSCLSTPCAECSLYNEY